MSFDLNKLKNEVNEVKNNKNAEENEPQVNIGGFINDFTDKLNSIEFEDGLQKILSETLKNEGKMSIAVGIFTYGHCKSNMTSCFFVDEWSIKYAKDIFASALISVKLPDNDYGISFNKYEEAINSTCLPLLEKRLKSLGLTVESRMPSLNFYYSDRERVDISSIDISINNE